MSDIKPIDHKVQIRSDQASQASQQSGQASSKEATEGHISVDSVEISRDAHSLRHLQSRIEQMESFDEARVASIKQAIENGEYPIDSNRLAERFLDLEDQLYQ